jgi:hypothetical protein
MMADYQSVWPPVNGKEYIKSEAFGRLLVRLTTELAQHYSYMDFTDAVAMVFAWFDQKLKTNRRFINKRRFSSEKAFIAYLKQAIWNAARLTERQRIREHQVNALSADQVLLYEEASPEELSKLHEIVEKLPDPHKTVFQRFFFEEDDPVMIASILDMSESQVHSLFEEATDMLGEFFNQ